MLRYIARKRFPPLGPRTSKRKNDRAKQSRRKQKSKFRFTPSKLGVLCTQELCKQYTMLAEENFPIPLSKQEQKIGTISQKKYDAYKVKNHPQQALHIVIQKPDKQCAGNSGDSHHSPKPEQRKNHRNNPLCGAWIDVTSARVYNKNISIKTERRKKKDHYENTCSERQSQA